MEIRAGLESLKSGMYQTSEAFSDGMRKGAERGREWAGETYHAVCDMMKTAGEHLLVLAEKADEKGRDVYEELQTVREIRLSDILGFSAITAVAGFAAGYFFAHFALTNI